jgi:hypothetical protein
MSKRKPPKNDCLRQCVARAVGRKPHRVPHFVKKYRGRWRWHLFAWLARTGHTTIFYPSKRGLPGFLSEDIRRWINVGLTAKGTGHAVLMEAAKNEPASVAWDGGHRLKKVQATIVILKRREA